LLANISVSTIHIKYKNEYCKFAAKKAQPSTDGGSSTTKPKTTTTQPKTTATQSKTTEKKTKTEQPTETKKEEQKVIT